MYVCSFGQSAIFLLGGATKQTVPYAMYVHSGDIVVMWGQSRLNYHGVPRILNPDPCLLGPDAVSSKIVSSQASLPQGVSSQALSSQVLSSQIIPSQDVPSPNLEISLDCDCVTTSVNRTMQETLLNLDWAPYAAYLSNSRINMNVRQVMPSLSD